MKQQLLATLFAAAAISPFGFGLSASAAAAGSSEGEIPLIYGGLVFYDGMTGADYALCAIDPTSNRPLRPVSRPMPAAWLWRTRTMRPTKPPYMPVN